MKAHTLILVLFILGLSSCNKKDGGNYPYKSWTMEIDNTSTHTLRLQFYSYHQPVLNVDTILSVNQKYALTQGNEDPLGGGPDLISMGAFDSAVVLFDDGKNLIYIHNKAMGVANDSANNLLLKVNYLTGGITGKREVYSYVLDDSDYLRAGK
jgi:hypothetical protein